jgi:tRNA threonylcarbamoyladenosine biosynthesis protein TsaB
MIHELPKLLILETSGSVGHVALAEGGTIVGARRLDETRRHARDLAPSVKELLHEQNWPLEEVVGVIVSIGPGSYTGLRVGIMSAKAWVYATGSKLIGVPSFHAIAHAARSPVPPQSGGVIEVIADAQQNLVYCQRFRSERNGLQPDNDLTIKPVQEWLAQLQPESTVSGPALRLHRDKLPQTVRIAAEADWDSSPQSLLVRGLQRFLNDEQDDVFALEPLYARPSSAEENWAKRQ